MLDELTTAVPLALAGTSFALGVRHGLDWDHIAAITDLTAPRRDDRDARRAGRRGPILHTGFAGPDHPVLPQLAEGGYLKALFFRL